MCFANLSLLDRLHNLTSLVIPGRGDSREPGIPFDFFVEQTRKWDSGSSRSAKGASLVRNDNRGYARSLFSSRAALALLLGFGLCFAAAPGFAAPTDAIKVEALSKTPKQSLPTSLEVLIDKSVPVTFDEPATTVFIANPEIADVQVISPTEVMVYGKKEGHTTLKITNKAGRDLVYKTVMVTQNLAALREALRVSLPGVDIKVESIPNGIVLTGNVNDASAIEDARRLALRYIPATAGDIINRLKIKANNQIQIRVRFAEVARDVDKRFGFNWNNLANMGGGIALGLATGNLFSGAGTLAASRTSIEDGVNNSLSTSFTKGRFTVNGMIDAMAENGLVTILAEPSLTALSGETASFLAGGEFPVPVPNGDQITIEWKHYGVSLAFTPTLIGEDRINLHVRPEVSQLTDTGAVTLNNITVPALTTRRAETTLELNSGQSFALAGLINSRQAQSVNKFPFLGDMPVLGSLFRSNRFLNDESELVIIITPYIVKPSEPGQLASPTDTFAPPTDTELFFERRETSPDHTVRPLSGPAYAVKADAPQDEADENEDTAPASLKAKAPAKPKAAPVLPVQTAPAPKMSLPAPSIPAAPVPVTTPAQAKPKLPAPMGAGGFIVE